MIKKIITHDGKAHVDEFLAVCFALRFNRGAAVNRRAPSRDELDDPNVLVLDTGRDWHPDLNNFDHHQLPGLPCTFHMYSEHLGIDANLKKYFSWYDAVGIIDTQGSKDYATSQGLSHFPGEIMPIQDQMLNLFARVKYLDSFHALYQIMYGIADNVVRHIDDVSNSIKHMHKDAQVIDIRGVRGIVYPHSDCVGRETFCKEVEPDAGFFVGKSNRDNEGFFIYRLADHPRVDFALLRSHPNVLFSHYRGFYAVTKPGIPIDSVYPLVTKCIQ